MVRRGWRGSLEFPNREPLARSAPVNCRLFGFGDLERRFEPGCKDISTAINVIFDLDPRFMVVEDEE
jgi:hypothetical protein